MAVLAHSPHLMFPSLHNSYNICVKLFQDNSHVDRSEGGAKRSRNAAETSVRSVAPLVSPKSICSAVMQCVFPHFRCLRSILCVAALLEDSGRHDGVVIAMLVSAR